MNDAMMPPRGFLSGSRSRIIGGSSCVVVPSCFRPFLAPSPALSLSVAPPWLKKPHGRHVQPPIVGAWLVINPSDPLNARPAIFAADGTLTIAYVPSYTDPERGVVLQGTAIGVWEPTGERGVHLTYVQALSDLNGTYLGTLTRDAYPEVSDDGQSFRDDGTQVHITFRDAANTIVNEANGGGGAEAATRQVHAIRMQVGNPGFLEEHGGRDADDLTPLRRNTNGS